MMSAMRPVLVIYAVWLIIALTVTIWILMAKPAVMFASDSQSYIDGAIALTQKGGFAHDEQPIVFRTPGYPILLAPLLWIGGSKGLLAVPFIQLGFIGLMGCVAYSLTGSLSPNRPLVARIALALVLFSPALWFTSLRVLSDVLFAALSLFAVRLSLVGLARERLRLAILGSGVLMTAAAFVRPVGLYLPYLFFPCLATNSLIRKRWATAGLLALCLLGHIAATQWWTHRNRQLIGYGTFATVQEVNLYEYIAASIDAVTRGKSWKEVRVEYREAADELPEAERYGYMKRRAMEVIANHPVTAFKVWLKGSAALLFQSSLPEVLELTGQRRSGSGIIYKYHSLSSGEFIRYLWEKELPLVALLGVGFALLCPFWAAVVAGIRPAFRADAVTAATLLGVMLYLLVISSGPQTMARFRVPMVPYASIFAAIGVDWAWTAIRNRRKNKNKDGGKSPAVLVQ